MTKIDQNILQLGQFLEISGDRHPPHSLPITFFYKLLNYSVATYSMAKLVAKVLQDQYHSNRLANVLCPFQLDGAEWLHSYTIFKFSAMSILGDMSPQSQQNASLNVSKISPPTKAKLPNFVQSMDQVRSESIPNVFESTKSIKAFSSYLSAKKKSVHG